MTQQQLRLALIAIVALVLGLTAHAWHRLTELDQERSHVVMAIAQLQDQPKIAAPPPPLRAEPRGGSAPTVTEPHSTIEVEALGAKLKMIDQASWTMIVQLCVVWAFMLVSLVGYKFAVRRLQLA